MDAAQVGATVRMTVVTSEACHFCEQAQQELARLSQHFSLGVRAVPVESPEGAALLARHRPAMNPLVLADGAFFSAGRLPVKKLIRHLERVGATRTADGTA
ncbi:glutaredoxin [Isoptericola sp. b441]|uniref:Glutaredoxin n=1 Tax=Actinotalea lenta TaxID=3064654 RepID=A0ABT9D9N2_9CELL|nr:MULTISPECIES: glutaredoxin [unclassified Isoptericola]MDO8107609.1 glutaredoxin [Isoptericola sp. b441]MDO8120731.1 glutaredoxin [Isoptericola sp. b490]